MRLFIFLGFLIGFLFSTHIVSDTLSTKIDALIEEQLPQATVGILIQDAESDAIIYSQHAHKLLSPASNVKLFTAAAALYQLKPDYQFLTTLAQKDQDIYIQFSGAPSFTLDNLKELLSHLKKANIQTIQGNIILDVFHFKSPFYPGGVSYDDLGWYYSAPDSAVVLNKNAETYEFISAEQLDKPIQIKSKSNSNGLKLINQVITVTNEQAKHHCNLNIAIQSDNTLRLFGCLPQTRQPKIMQLAIPNPTLFAKQQIQKILNEEGITLKGKIIKGKLPQDAQIINQHSSAVLQKLVSYMLRESDNLYANSLTKQLGYAVTGEGTYKQGVFAIKKILSQYVGLNPAQLEITDGMGTRYNLATPEQIVFLLHHIYQNKELFPIFLNALPQAGVYGTLQGRMKQTSLEKKVFAKTGSMHDISSLSGYLITDKNKTFIFSIITNGINIPLHKVHALEEKILLAVNEIPFDS